MKKLTFILLVSLTCIVIGCDSEDGGDDTATSGEMMAGAMAGEMTAGEMTAGAVTAGEMTAGEMTLEYLEPTLTVRALNPLNGSGVQGMNAELTTPQAMDESGRVGMTTSTTSADGTANLGAKLNTTYEVILTSDQHAPHHIIGDLGDEAVEQVTFVSTFTLTNQVFSLLNLTSDPDKGIVVIGLDLPNLAPAVGASAELSQSYESAFVFGTTTPIAGQTILSGGGGFVSFANVTPGETQVSVTPPEGARCAVFPAEERDQPTIQVYPGEVTVLAFTCRSE